MINSIKHEHSCKILYIVTQWGARPRGYKTFPCSTQLSTKFILFIILKCQHLAFMSIINAGFENLKARTVFIFQRFSFYAQIKFHAELSMKKSFMTSGPCLMFGLNISYSHTVFMQAACRLHTDLICDTWFTKIFYNQKMTLFKKWIQFLECPWNHEYFESLAKLTWSPLIKYSWIYEHSKTKQTNCLNVHINLLFNTASYSIPTINLLHISRPQHADHRLNNVWFWYIALYYS